MEIDEIININIFDLLREAQTEPDFVARWKLAKLIFPWDDLDKVLDLVEGSGEHLPHWFEADKFPWIISACLLPGKCGSHLDFWWDRKRFNWQASAWLPLYQPGKFKTWWDRGRFDYDNGSAALAELCPDCFKDWWPGKDKFN